MFRQVLVGVGVVAVFATGQAALAQPDVAVMEFGNTGEGTGFGGGGASNQSAHAADKMVPRTVVISAGGTVAFPLSNAVHGIGLYEAGTEPSDIDLSLVQFLGGCPPAPYLTDAEGRLAAYAPICHGGAPAPSFTFDSPGRYLVICTFSPHFEFADMWGWVIVR